MFLLIAGRIIQVILTVAQIRLATSLLDPSGYGVWVLILTTANLFVLFGISPFGLYLNRHVTEWEIKKLLPAAFKGYTAYMFAFSVLMSVATLLIVLTGIVDFGGMNPYLVIFLVGILMFAQTFHQTWIPTLNFLGDRKNYVIGSVFALTLSLACAWGLSFFGFESVLVWGLCIVVGYLISTLIFIPKNWISTKIPNLFSIFQEIDFKDVAHFTGPLFLTTVFGWGQSQGFRLLAENKMGLSNFGKFAAGYTVVAGLLGSLEGVIANFYQVNFFQKINSSRGGNYSSELQKVWSTTLYPYSLATIFLFLTAPILSTIFLSRNFSDHMEWLGLVSIAEGGRLLMNVISVHYHGLKKTSRLILPQFLGVTIALGLIFTSENLTPKEIILSLSFGYLAAVILMVLGDLKSFIDSAFFTSILKCLIPSMMFFVAGKYLMSVFDGFNALISLCICGAIFMFPYFFRHLRGSHV